MFLFTFFFFFFTISSYPAAFSRSLIDSVLTLEITNSYSIFNIFLSNIVLPKIYI